MATGLVAEISAWQTHSDPHDQGQVIAEWLDTGGVLLGTVVTRLQHVGTAGWGER